MKRDDVIRLARECGFQNPWEKLVGCGGAWVGDTAVLERFYDAAFHDGAEAEREACARLAERYDDLDTSGYDTAHSIANAIRARGEK